MYFKRINMNDRLQKNIRTNTKRRNKRDSVNIYMSQFWCMLASKPPKSGHVSETHHSHFLRLLSLPDFSTDFLDFAEALFCILNFSQLQMEAQRALLKHFAQWRINYRTRHVIIFTTSYYVNIRACMSWKSPKQGCKERKYIHIYPSSAHGVLGLTGNCTPSLKGQRRNHMSVLVTPSRNGALIPFIIFSNKYIWDPSDVNSGSEKSMN